MAAGLIRPVPKLSRPDRFIEFEGSPDLVAEVISDSSVRKDARQLPEAYFAAGVREYWLVDAREEQLRFEINRRAATTFEVTLADDAGYQLSSVLQHRFQLVRERDEEGVWDYDLLIDAAPGLHS